MDVPDPAETRDPFPREELTTLIQGAESWRRRRQLIQRWVLALAFFLLALGLPGHRLWGHMELPRTVAGMEAGYSYGMFFPLAVGLKALGLGAEQACYLLAAIFYGLCLPAMVSLLTTIGFAYSISLLAAGTTLMSGLAWLGATQPGDLSMGVFGATLLLRTLFQPREVIPNGYMWRVGMLFLLAFVLKPENLLLFPAVAWAAWRRPGRWGGAVGVVSFILVISVSMIVLLGPDLFGPRWGHLGNTLLAGKEGTFSGLGPWFLAMLGGLGVSLFGLYSLLFGRRRPEETSAPKWIVPWCVVALTPIVGGRAEFGPVSGYLLPAAAVGLADWLARRERREDGLRLGTGMFVAQLVLTVTVSATAFFTDPLRSWSTHARERLEPMDLVLTEPGPRAYLASVRWDLELPGASAEDLNANHREGIRRGERRLVFFDPPTRPGAVLAPGLDAWVLTDEELVFVPAGETRSTPEEW